MTQKTPENKQIEKESGSNTIGMSGFTHLHTHSHYSLLNALPKIPELVARAKEENMTALALTDDGNLYGAIQFYTECRKNDIKPIIGADMYMALRTRHDKQAGVDNKRFRLVLLAKNSIGYKNLKELVTRGYTEGFYYKPRIDHELLSKYGEGIICIVPSFSGEIIDRLKVNDEQGALEKLAQYSNVFKEGDLYLELTHHPEIPGHEENQQKLISFARKHNVPLVAAHDVYYLDQDDRSARETLVSVQSMGSFSRSSRITDGEEDFSFISQSRAKELFKHTPDALENVEKITTMCDLEITLGEWVFPAIETPEGKSYDEALRELAYNGFEKRGLEKTEDAVKRLDYELGIIKTKGYSPYFLIVADLLRFAAENKILTNIRGSVSGSLVTYLSGITNINPLEYRIPFERFLNPDRPSPPDIDMDFADDRRDEVIEYAREKYGRDKVAQIGTFGTMMARGSVRDTARALGYPYDVGDKIAKLIPMGSQGFPMTIERALEMEKDLEDLYKKDADVKRIIDMAQKIEGCARHISVHAAGVVISPTDITDFTPLQVDPKGGKLITQFDMHAVEDAGLLKFDFLGLKNLAILANAMRLVKKWRGVEVSLDSIPLDDEKTYQMLTRGETMGVFQLNGQGMTKFLKELKPTRVQDIHAMVALYRPGPIQFIPLYIQRKHNPQTVTYMTPELEPILKQTYGVLVYQDDLLIMAHELAGYSWLEVDKFRKAVGKKIPELMAEQKEKFIKGCMETSKWSREKSEEIWAWIEPFAAYGFNKAHSVSYGHVAYQTAYMKANYPVEYMTAILTADSGDVDKIHEAVEECKRLDIEVLPPSINDSFGAFTIVQEDGKDKIRFGLYSIKNFGQGIGDTIIEERKRGGQFTSIANFLERITDRNLNKKSLESLIKAGALDAFGTRGELLHNLEGLLLYKKEHEGGTGADTSLFALMDDTSTVPTLKLEEAEPAPQEEMLGWEKELLGMYVSGHPLDRIRDKLEKREFTIERIKTKMHNGMTVVACGLVEDVKEILTKKGDHMAFVKISDFTGSIEIVVFPDTYQKFKDMCQTEKCVAIRGKLSHRNDTESVIADSIKEI